MDTSVQRHYCSIEQDNIYSFVSHINGNIMHTLVSFSRAHTHKLL